MLLVIDAFVGTDLSVASVDIAAAAAGRDIAVRSRFPPTFVP